MRVTANTFPNSLVDQLNRLAIRQNRLQEQAATGQRVTRPDDDPVAMRRILDMQSEAGTAAQYLRNIDRNQELAAASFGSMKALKKLVDRAGEIATLADGLKSTEELRAYATEINQLIQQAVQLGNTRNRGDSLFAGTLVDRPAFVMALDPDGQVTAVTYGGNADLPENEVAGDVTLTAQAVGANLSGAGPRGLFADSRVGADLFQHLISLRGHLQAGDTDAIAATSRGELAADADNLLYHLGTNGAVQSRLETVRAVMKDRAQSLESLVSKEADSDLAQTLVRLNEVQTAYQAAMQSGGLMLNRSLMDYLR